MFVGINHVTIVVKDKKIAEDFYFVKLGLEKILVGKSLWARVGNQFIHINENHSFQNFDSFAHFAIEVDNFKQYIQALIEKGLKIFDLDDNLVEFDVNENLDRQYRSFFTKDPFGNIVEFIDSNNTFFKAN